MIRTDPEELLARARPNMMIVDFDTGKERPIKNQEMMAIITYSRTELLPRLRSFLAQMDAFLTMTGSEQGEADDVDSAS